MRIKPLRAAVILFALTALTSYLVCGTYAKYTVSDTGSDSARVAKWGITVFAEGSLFGENYDGEPSNTITQNDDGSITVKSHHKVALADGSANNGNVVAPGTKNDTGLTFGFNGKAETATKLDVTVKNQNISLRPGVYYFIHKIKETVTDDNFSSLEEKYGTLYSEVSDGFQKAVDYSDTVSQYYWIDNKVDFTTSGNWPYCPVVYEINPVDSENGLECTKARIKDFTPNASKPYYINFKNKNLDIISYFIFIYGLSDSNAGWAPNGGWPAKNSNDVFTRSFSKMYAAGTDLSKISLSYPRCLVGLNNERLTWSWDYQQAEDSDLYNKADNILGRLAAEKKSGHALDDNFVVVRNRSVSIDKYGQLIFSVADNDDKLIKPVEYTDYCLETMFDIEITISQID